MTSWVEGLRPTRHKIGHFEGVLPSKFPGVVRGARCQIEHTPKVYIPLFINRITTSSRTTLIGTKLNYCGSMLFLLECIERSVSKQLDRSSWYLAWRLPRRIRHCFKANSGNSKNKDISCKLCLKLLSGTLSRTLNCESFGMARRSLFRLECDIDARISVAIKLRVPCVHTTVDYSQQPRRSLLTWLQRPRQTGTEGCDYSVDYVGDGQGVSEQFLNSTL